MHKAKLADGQGWRAVNGVILGLSMALLVSCAQTVTYPGQPSSGHIQPDPIPATSTPPADPAIPKVVESAPPPLPAPTPVVEPERYTVVVNEVPVKELLFAVARDASLNVDIHPGIDGVVTLNAVQQTLPQILERIGSQVSLRYETKGDVLTVTPDSPYFRTYTVNFVNMSRDTTTTMALATGVGETTTTVGEVSGTSGGGENNSTTRVTSTSNQRFWSSLVSNIMAIVGEPVTQAAQAGTLPTSQTLLPTQKPASSPSARHPANTHKFRN